MFSKFWYDAIKPQQETMHYETATNLPLRPGSSGKGLGWGMLEVSGPIPRKEGKKRRKKLPINENNAVNLDPNNFYL